MHRKWGWCQILGISVPNTWQVKLLTVNQQRIIYKKWLIYLLTYKLHTLRETFLILFYMLYYKKFISLSFFIVNRSLCRDINLYPLVNNLVKMINLCIEVLLVNSRDVKLKGWFLWVVQGNGLSNPYSVSVFNLVNYFRDTKSFISI